MNNLPEIRDIHIPDGVSVFPLAYGWWIMSAALIVCALCFWVVMKQIKTSRKHYALKTLNSIDTQLPISAAIQISELLKRICLSKYKNASALYGTNWIDFLNGHASEKLTGAAAELLVNAPFIGEQSKTYTINEAETLKRFAKIWIGENL